MDVDFMFSDSLEALKTKVVQPKTIEEAAAAVDAMFAAAFQNAGCESTKFLLDTEVNDSV